jgi:catechol 2,3-dioxygenase-like lactoylglutathione lyase family enzyme
MNIIGLHPFIPARDFELSLQFYQDLGFNLVWRDDALARLQFDEHAFFLQDFYVKEFAQNLMLHLHVSDVAAWWRIAEPLQQKYTIRAQPPTDQPWAMRDFVVFDPSGVLWRIAQNI